MLQNYIKLNDRKTGQKLDLTDKGIIISEKLAELAGVSVGDYLTVQNSQDKDIKLKVAGISEMYMGHFIFMNETTYKNAFGEKANQNANILTLKNHSDKNIEKLEVYKKIKKETIKEILNDDTELTEYELLKKLDLFDEKGNRVSLFDENNDLISDEVFKKLSLFDKNGVPFNYKIMRNLKMKLKK